MQRLYLYGLKEDRAVNSPIWENSFIYEAPLKLKGEKISERNLIPLKTFDKLFLISN